MTTGLHHAIIELFKHNPDPTSVAAQVLGELATEQQREWAMEAFAEYVRLSLEAMRRRGFSVLEVATALGVSDEQIYTLVRRGEIGHVRIGRHIRIPDHELDRFLSKAVAA